MLICNLSEGVVSLCPTVPIHKETLHLQYYNSTTIILMNITYTYVCIFRMFNINNTVFLLHQLTKEILYLLLTKLTLVSRLMNINVQLCLQRINISVNHKRHYLINISVTGNYIT